MKVQFKRNIHLFLLLIIIHIFYAATGLFLRDHGLSLNLKWLYWNLILAVVPLLISIVIYLWVRWRKKWDILSLPAALVWLVFLPNACYMVTDLIHLQGSSLIGGNGIYLQSMHGWIRLIFTTAGIFLALVDGLFSTSLIHQNVKFRKNPVFNWIWMITVSLLVGYGVYIGRFLRLNTWDILHPRSLLQVLLRNIDEFTILFSFMLAAFYFIAYLIFDRIMRSEVHPQ